MIRTSNNDLRFSNFELRTTNIACSLQPAACLPREIREYISPGVTLHSPVGAKHLTGWRGVFVFVFTCDVPAP